MAAVAAMAAMAEKVVFPVSLFQDKPVHPAVLVARVVLATRVLTLMALLRA